MTTKALLDVRTDRVLTGAESLLAAWRTVLSRTQTNSRGPRSSALEGCAPSMADVLTIDATARRADNLCGVLAKD